MKITAAQFIYFSPTSTSKKVAEAISRGVGVENIEVTDVTCSDMEELCIPADTLTVIAVPVYGGRVAPLAMQRIKNIRGNDTPVILVVVYGNRAYEKSLMELDAFAIKQGFKVIAAATFIGEHSYHTEEYPIAPGRPNAEDLLTATDFGTRVARKIEAAETPEKLYAIDVRAIKRPKQTLFGLLRFLRGVMKMRKQQTPAPRSPLTNEETCTHCGICVQKCPSGAIVEGEEQHTLTEKCIRCCACVKSCPAKARVLHTPFAPLLSKSFPKPKQPQVLL